MPSRWMVIRRLLALTWRDAAARRAFLFGLIEEGGGLACVVTAPFLLGRAVQRLPLAQADERTALMAGLVVTWLGPSLLAALKARHTATIVAGVYRQAAWPWIRHHLPPLALAHDRSGSEVLSRLERLPFNVQIVLDGLLWRTAPVVLQAGASMVAVSLAFPWPYAGLLGGVIAAFLVVADRGAVRLLARARTANLTGLRLAGALGDVVANAERVVGNGALDHEVRRLGAILTDRNQSQADLAAALSDAGSAQTLWLAVGLGLLLTVAAGDVAARNLSLDGFIVLQAYALRLALPLGGLAVSTRQADAALIDLAPPLALAVVGAPELAPVPSAPPSADLTLEAVTFNHPLTHRGVEQVSLDLASDQIVAIVGPNGSGKSTLGRLMAGLLKPQTGCVRVGGVDLAALDLSARPSYALYVPQTVGLFHRSLQDNALYPPAKTSPEALAARLKQWRFYADETAIDLARTAGEHGGALSGGQVQKLELARLCAVATPVLILDESTSALDGEGEAEIFRTLRAHAAGRLLILVTHKRRLAEWADQVVFMSGGRLAAFGPHSNLMTVPAYRRLWQ